MFSSICNMYVYVNMGQLITQQGMRHGITTDSKNTAKEGHLTFYCFVDILILFYLINTSSQVSGLRSHLLTSASPHHHTVHRQEELARPRAPGSQHQEELPVHVLEGDLSPHPGLGVRAVLLDLHLAGLPSVGPGQHRQRSLAAARGKLLKPEVKAGQGRLGRRDQLLEVELGRVQRGEGHLLVLVASPLPVSPRLSAVPN